MNNISNDCFIIANTKLSNIHLAIVKDLVVIDAIFRDITYSEGGGGAIYIANDELTEEFVGCSFINNIVTAEKSYAGSILIYQSKLTSINCTYIDHNSAYYACAYRITNRQTPFIVVMNQISTINGFHVHENTHFDMVGGNPLNIKNYNLSKYNCEFYGFLIDSIEADTHDVISYFIYEDCFAGNGYFLHDQRNIFPNSYFCDKSSFVNNSISDFYSRRTIQGTSASFFDCDFIFDKIIPTFNYSIILYNCFISPLIKNTGSLIFESTLDHENGNIEKLISIKCLSNSQNLNIERYSSNEDVSSIILTSLFILNSNNKNI